MSLTGLQIYLWPRMTLSFDVLHSNLIVSWLCTVDHLCKLASKSVHSFSKYFVYEFGNRRTDGRTNEQTDKLKTLCLRLPVEPGGGLQIFVLGVIVIPQVISNSFLDNRGSQIYIKGTCAPKYLPIPI